MLMLCTCVILHPSFLIYIFFSKKIVFLNSLAIEKIEGIYRDIRVKGQA